MALAPTPPPGAPAPPTVPPQRVTRGRGDGAALVVCPSAFGVAADLEAQLAELVDDASVAVTFDPFVRGDAGVVPYTDRARVMARLAALDRERTYADVVAAVERARAEAPGRAVVALGICFGGPFALRAAADGLVDGVVTWHGTRLEATLDRAGEMRAPMHLHFGASDPVVPPEAVEAVRAAFHARDDVCVFVHAGATHGFSHRAAPQAYDAAAERAAMDSVRALVSSVPRRAGR